MEIKYFENYLEQQYDEGKIDTMFPDKKGNVKLCCPFKHKRSVFDDETWEEKEIEYYEVIPSSSINLNMRVFHCFSKDTEVITKEGIREIGDLLNKDVEIINGNGEWEHVIFKKYGKQNLMKLNLTSNGLNKTIYTTDGHEWLVQGRKNKVKTIDLKTGTRLQRQWLHLDKNLNNFTNYTDFVEGQRHGFIYGDGTLTKGNYRAVANICDKNKLEYCKPLFLVSKPCPSIKKNMPNCLGRITHVSTYNPKKLPDINSSKEYLLGFLTGYFMADGCCSDNGVQINSVNKDDLVIVKHICTIMGIPTYPIRCFIRTPNSNMGIVNIKDDKPIYTLRLVKSEVPSYFYNEDKRPKKYSTYKSYLGWTVVSVEPTNRFEDVYCCETSTHSFVLKDFILTGNCFTCDRTYKELEFAQAITGKSKEELLKEHVSMETLKSANDTWAENQHKALLENQNVLDKLNGLKITKEVIEGLNLGYMTNCLATPVFKNGKLINIARYNINKDPNYPKVRYNENTNSGDIVPFDIWKKDFRATVICEGEKDMLVARSNNFNAITLTGGSQSSLQSEYFEYFKDRDVYICYDNDDAGVRGAKKLYKDLQRHCKNVYVADISSICVETKEDVTDFFVKYNKSHDNFKDLLLTHSKKYSEKELEEVQTKHEIPLSKIENNIEESKFGKTLKSTLQIIATCTETYSVPEFAIFRPFETDEEETKPKAWYIGNSKESFLELMEGKVVKNQVPDIIANQLGLPSKWQKYYNCELGSLQTIYKVSVTDVANENDEKASEFTIELYSKQPLDIGSIYEITYKLYPHPKQGRKTIAIAEKIEETNYEFDVNNEDYIQSLEKFKADGYIGNKINELYESAKCHIAPYLNKDLWFLMDLVFNSPLDITFNKPMRGALDVFVLGDTRTGKSETSRALKELYDFGEVVPLKTSTVASLIGGTDDKLKRTKLGVLPRYHKELVIMEEFSGAPLDFIKTLTEVRSSSMVKIYRVAGDIQAPCKIRMITISNPISENNNLMTLSSYPNGIEPINELIKSPEDIARYDAFILVPRVEKLSNPFAMKTNDEYKIDAVAYKHKSKWIKSLTSDNVKISDELGSYIFEKGVELNNMFESSFTLFGSETDKKIARLSSALACMLCSTDDYKNVKVTKEHVDYIVEFIKSLYDNQIFRLKEFADEEKSYNVVVDEDTKELENIYPKNVTFINFLANTSKVNRNELQTVSGLNRDEFTRIFNLLVSRKFIKLSRDSVSPTVKFRNTYRIMNKNFNLNDTSKLDENLDVFG